MFRKLTEADRDRLMAYVMAEPEPNLFIIGDTENYGLEGETVSVYAGEAGAGWDSVALFYLDNRVIYAQSDGYDAAALADFLKREQFGCLSGKASVVERLAEYFPEKKLCREYLSRCRSAGDPVPLPDGMTFRVLTVSDIDAMIKMYSQIEEFADTYGDERGDSQREALRLSITAGDINLGVFDGDKLIAGAATAAKNSVGAMVVAVATLPEYRGRGVATAMVRELSAQAFACGLSFLCLFYDAPGAGRIYHRAGYADIGGYVMLR